MGKEALEYYHQLCQEIDQAQQSIMFGAPCYKLPNKKAFTCFYDGCMVAKLDSQDVSLALQLPDAMPFDPSGKGRPMKAWVMFPYDLKLNWKAYLKLAADFVITL